MVSLIQKLDQDLLAIVQKLTNEEGGKRLTTSAVYDKIRNSNSSLKRKPKKLLENRISKVLDDFNHDLDDSDSVVSDFKGSGASKDGIKDHNVINRNITRMWATSTPNLTPTNISANMAPSDHSPTNTSTAPIRLLNGDTKGTPPGTDRNTNGEPPAKRRKAVRGPLKEVDRTPPTNISLSDLGGVDDIIDQLHEDVAFPMLFPHVYIHSGIQPSRGVLLHGPPGCGKTMLANAFAATLGVSFIPLSAPSLVAGMSGESEKKIREVFKEAKRMAPCLVFIDEIDVIMGKREIAQREMEKRIVAQMLTCMDDMTLEKTDGKSVIILAATNRPDSLDPALRRAGRFNKEINLGVPNEEAREKILRALTQKLTLPENFNYRALAKLTPGFVGADLNDIVSVAGTESMKRMIALLKERTASEMELDTKNTSPALASLLSTVAHAGEDLPGSDFTVTYDDFLSALPKVQPSAKREGFATIPDTTWAHIGALHDIRQQLKMAIVEPIKRPEDFAKVGITAPAGVLLWGPPGCGKTLLAKAVANESKANFISIKGPELLNKYVGESERAVRQVFERARSSVPCILFFDELDALVPKRDDSLSEASSRVVNTLLTELDGMGSRAGIFVIAATNRPDMIDSAMLRPGRLGTSVFVDLPTPDERVEILKTLYKKVLPSAPAEEVEALAPIARHVQCTGFSGADLGNLHQAAAAAALNREAGEDLRILREDWEAALEKTKPSVRDANKYRMLKERGV